MHMELFNFTEHEQLNLSDDFLISEHFLCYSEIPQYFTVKFPWYAAAVFFRETFIGNVRQ